MGLCPSDCWVRELLTSDILKMGYETSIIRAKKRCDICYSFSGGEQRVAHHEKVIEYITEIAGNPAGFYVASRTERPLTLVELTEIELRDKSKKWVEAMPDEAEIGEILTHYLSFLRYCVEDCEKARKHLDELYKKALAIIKKKSDDISQSIRGIRSSPEKLEKFLDAYLTQLKYLGVLGRKTEEVSHVF